MATYSVVAADGQMYGPADEATLVQWVREGRIAANTLLHWHETGQRVWSQSVPSLAPLLGLPPGVVNQLMQPGAAQQQRPAGYPQAQAAYPQQAPYPQQQSPYQQAGYPQPGMMPVGYAGPMTGTAGHQLTSFSVAGVVLLTFCTLGIFPWIHFGLMHDKLPKNRIDDPSAAKAILFHLIPFFNLYWHFFDHLRLMDRVDEQRTLIGLPPAAPRGMFIATSVMLFIPIVNYLSILIMVPITIGLCQAHVNGLVDASRGR